MTAVADPPEAPAPAERHLPWLTTLRLVLVFACTVAAFWTMWAELYEDIEQGSDVGYVFALPALAAFAAIGVALRRGPELPIYDRQTDVIVGLIGLSIVGLLALLVLRYRYEYEVLHLDLVAAPIFLMSGCVLLFGLRPVFRFWPVWLLVLVCSIPLIYRLAVLSLGASRFAYGAVMLVPAAIAAAIGAGRSRGRALAAVLITLAVGSAVLLAMWWFFTPSILAYQLIPSIAATAVATSIAYLYHRNWKTMRPLGRPFLPHTAARSLSAGATLLVATALTGLIPTPQEYALHVTQVPGLVIADVPQVPPGWQLLSERKYPWAPKYLGPRGVWTRQQWQAVRGNPEWDKDSRRRRIMVDIVRAGLVHRLDFPPEFVLYALDQPRVSPPVRIDLGYGVTARLNTVVDDRQLLSWTWLSWSWQGEDGVERVSLIAADNHLPDAAFPQPDPSTRHLISNQLHQILRGNAVVTDPESEEGEIDSEHKDLDMLTTVAREVVRSAASR